MRVTGGFVSRIDINPIKVRIQHVALMQLIDCKRDVAQADKICPINRIFIAPEVKNEKTIVTEMADIWSIGAILYFLVSSQVIQAKGKGSGDSEIFTFGEPEWASAAPILKSFIEGCLYTDPKKRLKVQ